MSLPKQCNAGLFGDLWLCFSLDFLDKGLIGGFIGVVLASCDRDLLLRRAERLPTYDLGLPFHDHASMLPRSDLTVSYLNFEGRMLVGEAAAGARMNKVQNPYTHICLDLFLATCSCVRSFDLSV